METVKPPVWFWVVALVAVLWNAMGAWDYTATQLRLDFYMESYTPEQLEYFFGFPAWYDAIWAIAVWSAFGASVLLALRKRWTITAWQVSMVSFLLSSIYVFGFTDAVAMMGIGGVIFSIVIFASLVGFYMLSRWADEKGILS